MVNPFLQPSSKILIFSSFIFLTNFIFGLYKNEIIYSILFLFLTITSVSVHSYNNVIINIIDKFVIFSIFCYDLYLIYYKVILSNTDILSISQTSKLIAIFSSLFFVLLMYIGGYFLNEFCFEPYEKNTEIYHILMHFVGSLGSIWILYL